MLSTGVTVSYSSKALSYNGVTLVHTSSNLMLSTGVTVSYSSVNLSYTCGLMPSTHVTVSYSSVALL